MSQRKQIFSKLYKCSVTFFTRPQLFDKMVSFFCDHFSKFIIKCSRLIISSNEFVFSWHIDARWYIFEKSNNIRNVACQSTHIVQSMRKLRSFLMEFVSWNLSRIYQRVRRTTINNAFLSQNF